MNDTLKAAMPVRKVGAGAIAGALTVVLVFVLNGLWDVEVTPEVAAAMTVLFTFVASWFTPAKEA